jgi:hypothetical protein
MVTKAVANRWHQMNNTPERDEIPYLDDNVEDYAPLLLAFGPADHEFETEGSDDADAYIVGYN